MPVCISWTGHELHILTNNLKRRLISDLLKMSVSQMSTALIWQSSITSTLHIWSPGVVLLRTLGTSVLTSCGMVPAYVSGKYLEEKKREGWIEITWEDPDCFLRTTKHTYPVYELLINVFVHLIFFTIHNHKQINVFIAVYGPCFLLSTLYPSSDLTV